jgi:signal transduction histidine kinase
MGGEGFPAQKPADDGPREDKGPDSIAARVVYARVAAAFFVVSGVLAFIPTLTLQGSDRNGMVVVGVAAIVFGVAVWFAPWQRWPQRALLWLVVVPGLILVALANLYGGSDYHTYGVFFVVAFVLVGLTQPPGTSLLVAPFAILAYVLPIYQLPGDVGIGASTALITIPICVVVGEGLAQGVKRVRQIQSNLDAQTAEVLRLKEQEELASALRESLDLLRTAQAEQRELAAQLQFAEEEERRRISTGLHDDPVQLLTAALLRLDGIRQARSGEDSLELQRVKDLLTTTIEHIRHMMFELRPDSLDRHGLATAVMDLARYYGDSPPVCRVESSLETEPPDNVRIVAFRIIAEAISNAHRHSHANEIRILIEEDQGGLSIQVHDDGVGIDPALTIEGVPGHYGVPGMIERAHIAGGHAEVFPSTSGGTAVDVWLPMGLG